MKKIGLPLVFVLFYSTKPIAQQNTFPTVGNVGIGTTSPSVKLDVNGALKVENQTLLKGEVKMPNLPLVTEGVGQETNQYKYLIIGEDGVIRRRSGDVIGHGDTDDSSPCGLANNEKWDKGPNKLYVRCPDVNVGISTNAPRVKLDVIGGGFIQKLSLGALNTSPSSAKLLDIQVPASVSLSDKIFAIHNSSNEILSIHNTGRFALKTSLLESDFSTVFSINNHDNQVFSISNKGTLNTYQINATHKFFLSTGRHSTNDPSIDIFAIINSDKRIFQVMSNGLLLVREIKLNQTWADYVFEKQYPLMPLKEVEQFVKTNKHLPNVPSAKEIEDNGIGLSETNRIFIEKIEELTLYLIEQDKNLNLLQTKINSLEKELEELKQK